MLLVVLQLSFIPPSSIGFGRELRSGKPAVTVAKEGLPRPLEACPLFPAATCANVAGKPDPRTDGPELNQSQLQEKSQKKKKANILRSLSSPNIPTRLFLRIPTKPFLSIAPPQLLPIAPVGVIRLNSNRRCNCLLNAIIRFLRWKNLYRQPLVAPKTPSFQLVHPFMPFCCHFVKLPPDSIAMAQEIDEERNMKGSTDKWESFDGLVNGKKDGIACWHQVFDGGHGWGSLVSRSHGCSSGEAQCSILL
ncbi:hypothetical protein NE237_025633 [Protea cynaroides]|uniref:Uncharacterized protein n=1 Tax=Protea cynaroides TaxID=273540 RepID=A0A9Q0H283_9MAGN|nr:hypothetical protein NE237_025633 [Protea cynaroides]